MKSKLLFSKTLLYVLLVLLLLNCKKDHPKTLPVVTSSSSSSVTNITGSSVTVSGEISSDGGDQIIARGFCWSSTNTSPTTSDYMSSDGTGSGKFTSALTGLLPGTTYNIRSYATNSVGTVYGNAFTFKTAAILPTVSTTTASSVTNITSNSAKVGGEVTADGGDPVTARGYCWSSTNTTPTISDSKSTDGTGSGVFTSSLTGLLPGTTYSIRSYATNSVGTVYGNVITFTTTVILPTLTTTDITGITTSAATAGGNITADGGGAITARGVCWNTISDPTISNNKTIDGTGVGIFTSSISGLTSGTTYYLRAYATNSIGTAYGSQQTFTTTSVGLSGTVTDIDGNVYNTVTIGTQVWMAENLKTTKYRNGDPIPNVTVNSAWTTLTTGAYCWYNNDAPANKAIYGALYNWHSVSDSRNIAPTGWHVPTNAEWTTLTTFLGGENIAGGKLKETGTTHWLSPNTGATNTTGFTALPGGYRDWDGTFHSICYYGGWWSSTEGGTDGAAGHALIRFISRSDEYISKNISGVEKEAGSSVRCVRD